MGSVLSNLFVDTETLPDDGYGFVQLVFLTMIYGTVLFFASGMISDGSELLLATPWRGLVGTVVLPILGAVPDGAIVIFSGLGADAQKQMNVGVGALAGSTVMLLTLPWALAIIAGRVNLVDGVPGYEKPYAQRLSPPGNMGLCTTGVACGEDISKNGRLMLLTALGYVIIQGAGFTHQCELTEHTDKTNDCATEENAWAGVGLVYCILAFIGYLVYQVYLSNSNSKIDRTKAILRKLIKNGHISYMDLFREELLKKDASRCPSSCELTENPAGLSNPEDVELGSQPTIAAATKVPEQLREYEEEFAKQVLQPFFDKFDTNCDRRLDMFEFHNLVEELGTEVPNITEFRRLYDTLNEDGLEEGITLEELIDGLALMCQELRKYTKQRGPEGRTPEGELDEEGEGEEDVEIPDELQDDDPGRQLRKILQRSFLMMSIGTVVVLLFSDPVVDCFSQFGDRTGIPAFYISFLFAPMASNAAELIAAYNYAIKRTNKDMTISFSALLGAANMNNTFCLGIFLALIFFKKLIWEFAAETICIIVAELLMFVYSQRSVHQLMDAGLVFAIYPLTMGIVAGLEAAGLN